AGVGVVVMTKPLYTAGRRLTGELSGVPLLPHTHSPAYKAAHSHSLLTTHLRHGTRCCCCCYWWEEGYHRQGGEDHSTVNAAGLSALAVVLGRVWGRNM